MMQEKNIEDYQIEDYRKDLELYTIFYKELLKAGHNKEINGIKKIKLIQTGFYNCLALSGRLSWTVHPSNIDLTWQFIKLTKEFMYFGGLDEMSGALMAVEWCATLFYSKEMNAMYRQTELSEKEYHNIIIEHFEEIEQFKKYKFIRSQFSLPAGDKGDILAEDIVSKRPVLIELKIKNKSGHKQLRSYAIHYDNPILINVSVKQPNNKRKDIIYYLYNELLPDVFAYGDIIGKTDVPQFQIEQQTQLQLF